MSRRLRATRIDDPDFLRERQARLNRQQFRIAVREFLRENSCELSMAAIFFLMIAVMTGLLTGTLHALDRVQELQREIQLLRALAS